MSKNDHYKWLELQLRLHAAATLLSQKCPCDDDAGARLHLRDVFARAGRFEGAPSNSANDLSALLFVLLLIWWWNYANSCAKLTKRGAVLREINAGRFFGGSPWNPHQMGASAISVAASACAISITSP